MAIKLVILFVVCVVVVAGNTLTRDQLRKTIHENLMKREHGGPHGAGQHGGKGQGKGPAQGRDRAEFFRNTRIAIRRLEDIIETIIDEIELIVNSGEQLSADDLTMFVETLLEFKIEAEAFEYNLERLEDSASQSGLADEGTSAGETTEEPSPTTPAMETTASPTTEAEGTTADSGTTAAPTPADEVTTAGEEATTAGSGTTDGTQEKRLSNLKKTLLRTLLLELEERRHK